MGITKRKELTRFSEQAWLVIFHSSATAFDMVCEL
jgi:hypothetical protein